MEYGEIDLSLLKNSTLVFDNTIGANKENINAPITYKDYVVGVIIYVTEGSIYCRIWDKLVRFYPEFKSPDGIEEFTLFGINVSLPMDEINKQLETENYVAIEMYKQFMKDDPSECAKVRKQILKNQPINYFKNVIK